jgi:hypothetical protein
MPRRECLRFVSPTVGYASTDTPGVDVPTCGPRLRGRWLQDAGFAIGRHVKRKPHAFCIARDVERVLPGADVGYRSESTYLGVTFARRA